ncbi:MAG: hypothetical protein H7Z21_03790 [Hymenobacter sp.]|nr:hypothetical protein [Hymenobacter sp.]
MATVPGLTVRNLTVRDDVRRGLVADVEASGATGLNVEQAVRQALQGYPVPYALRGGGVISKTIYTEPHAEAQPKYPAC